MKKIEISPSGQFILVKSVHIPISEKKLKLEARSQN